MTVKATLGAAGAILVCAGLTGGVGSRPAAASTQTAEVVIDFACGPTCAIRTAAHPRALNVAINGRAFYLTKLRWRHWGQRDTSARGRTDIGLVHGVAHGKVTVTLRQLMKDGCGRESPRRLYYRMTLKVSAASPASLNRSYRVDLPPAGCKPA